MNTKRFMTGRQAGFTLLELLVVLTIVGILALSTVSTFQGVMDAQRIQGAADAVKGQLELARQLAITKDQPIQCRLYQSTENNGYFALRAFYDGTETPATPFVLLPRQIVVTNNATYSNLPATLQGPDLTGSKYIAVRFRVDGSTDLDPTLTYTMTILASRSSAAITALPKNFITLQLNPVSGKSKSFQP